MARSTTYRQRWNRNVMIEQDVVVLVDFGKSGSTHGIHPALVMSRQRKTDGNTRWMVIPLYRRASYGTGLSSVSVSQKDCLQLHHDMFAQPMLIQSVATKQVVRRIGKVLNGSVHKEVERLLWEEVSA